MLQVSFASFAITDAIGRRRWRMASALLRLHCTCAHRVVSFSLCLSSYVCLPLFASLRFFLSISLCEYIFSFVSCSSSSVLSQYVWRSVYLIYLLLMSSLSFALCVIVFVTLSLCPSKHVLIPVCMSFRLQSACQSAIIISTNSHNELVDFFVRNRRLP